MSKITTPDASMIDELDLTSPSETTSDAPEDISGEFVALTQVTDVVTLPAFDYADLSEQVIREAETVADKIRSRVRANIIDTGQDLLSIKDKLGHGKFGPWLKFHFGMSERTAQNMMRAADAFHHRPVVVDRMPPVVVYKLAAKSVQDIDRDAIAREITLGALLDPEAVLSRIEAAKSKANRGPQTDINVSDAEYEVLPNDANAISTEAATPVETAATDQHQSQVANTPASVAEALVKKAKLRLGDKFDIFRRTLLVAIEDVEALRQALNNP